VRVRWSICAGLLVAVCFGVSGCRQAPAASRTKTKQYTLHGKIVSTNPATGEAEIANDNIPDFMSAMTMSYKMVNPSVLSELHPGDRITAALLVDEDAAGASNMRISEVDVVGTARPDYVPAVQYHVPTEGDVVPDFKLLNQSNHTIDLDQFHGKVVLMTFIYTRCPLSDYCPRMSRNFAEIDKALATDPALYAKTHLVSVSFDPQNDTPKVLKSYGSAYTGRYVQETFDHWTFAAPPIAELPKMEQYFDVGVTPGQSGTLQHSLSTVVIGKDGKVVGFWPTNDWTVQEVLAKVKTAAQ
jgi:protein SCO1/2